MFGPAYLISRILYDLYATARRRLLLIPPSGIDAPNSLRTKDDLALLRLLLVPWTRYSRVEVIGVFDERLIFQIEALRRAGLTFLNGYLLDIGCGWGSLPTTLTKLEKTFSADNYVGVDLNREFLLEAKKRFPNGHFILGDATKLCFVPGTFSTVFAMALLEHVEPRRHAKFLYDIGSGIRAGGQLALQIPNPYLLVEVHTKIPFFFYLPASVRRALIFGLYKRYYKDFIRVGPFPVSHKSVLANTPAILRLKALRTYWFPPGTLRMPKALYHILESARLFKTLPMGYLFVFERKQV
jgi:2-polyprenyl-3-methyl-5-hydroxy-6-metoxy-1,4-benzoquinol methylase